MIELKAYRKRAGLTQAELGRSLGISLRRTIGRWEADPMSLTGYQLEDYARICGVTLADLMGYDGTAQVKLDRVRGIVGPTPG